MNFFYLSNVSAAYEVLNNMESSGTSVTIKTHSVFLYDYANKGEIEKVKNILDECKSKEIDIPDKVLLTIVYNFAVNGFNEFVDEV